MRQGENALDVIERVKAKLQEIEPGLPAGRRRSSPTYDRSELILRSIDNLKHTLIEELIIVALVILSSSGTSRARSSRSSRSRSRC